MTEKKNFFLLFQLLIIIFMFNKIKAQDNYNNINIALLNIPKLKRLSENFDLKGFLLVTEKLKAQAEQSIDKKLLYSYALYKVGWIYDELAGDLIKIGREYNEQSYEITQSLMEKLANNERALELLSLNYIRLIESASDWFKYFDHLNKAIDNCLNKFPNNEECNFLKAKILLAYPASAGGNFSEGLQLLEQFYKKWSNNNQIAFELAFRYLSLNKIDETINILKKILKINGKYKPALLMLNEINLTNKKLAIDNINIANETKTSKNRLQQRLDNFKGETYTLETKQKMIDKIKSIPSIKTANITFNESKDNKVNLDFNISENNAITIAGISLFDISTTYDNKTLFTPSVAMVYMDENFLGTSDYVSIIFAGVYLNYDYIHTFRYVDFPLYIVNKADIMLLTNTLTFYKNGVPLNNYALESPNYAFNLNLEYPTSFGVKFELENQIKFKKWAKGIDNKSTNMILPSGEMMNRHGLNAKMSTAGDLTDRMAMPKGFLFEIKSNLIYQKNYIPWGNDDMIFYHDDSPMFMSDLKIGLFFTPFNNHGLRILLKALWSDNYYQTEKLKIGKPSLLDDTIGLNGYHSNELDFTKGLNMSSFYNLKLFNNFITLYTEYDLFYHIDEQQVYQGVALGMSKIFSSIYGIKSTLQIGSGINAFLEHNQPRKTLEFDLMFQKVWSL